MLIDEKATYDYWIATAFCSNDLRKSTLFLYVLRGGSDLVGVDLFFAHVFGEVSDVFSSFDHKFCSSSFDCRRERDEELIEVFFVEEDFVFLVREVACFFVRFAFTFCYAYEEVFVSRGFYVEKIGSFPCAYLLRVDFFVISFFFLVFHSFYYFEDGMF